MLRCVVHAVMLCKAILCCAVLCGVGLCCVALCCVLRCVVCKVLHIGDYKNPVFLGLG